MMKKSSVSSIMRGVGIAMTIGAATTLVGSTVVGENKVTDMKKYIGKALKSMGKMF